jgi:hypothetical protein
MGAPVTNLRRDALRRFYLRSYACHVRQNEMSCGRVLVIAIEAADSINVKKLDVCQCPSMTGRNQCRVQYPEWAFEQNGFAKVRIS